MPEQDKLQQDKLLLAKVMQKYAVSVTTEVMASINPDNPADPVALQYLPSVAELNSTAAELADPIGDAAHSPVKGIVHRYPDRVLLKPVHACAVYCRFCFRREMVGPDSEFLSTAELECALDYIRDTPQIWEVIVTGGDPFILSPRRLTALMVALNAIDHVKVIRFHTRVPIANPTRVTPALAAALDSDKAVYVVLHCNHAQELTAKVRTATQLLIKAGIPLLSQSVLLRGVNDNAQTLEALFRALTAWRIKPYYLHHPDLAVGTGHFRLPLAEGQTLAQSLWGKMSGIAQPRYVLDIPNGFGKVPVQAPWVTETKDGYAVTDYQSGCHCYRDE
jgi:lysine 2,3-aminomutase